MKSIEPNIFQKDLLDFLECVQVESVEAILVGGYAVVAHGYYRTTGDVDVWVNPTTENFDKLLKAFSIFGLPTDAIALSDFLNTSETDVFTFGIPPVAIDLMTKVKGLSFEKCFTGSESLKIGSFYFPLLALEDLKSAKRAAGRNKDLNDLENL